MRSRLANNPEGVRFGLLQVKVGLATLVRHYRFTACDRTAVPLVLDPRSYVTAAKGDHDIVEEARPRWYRHVMRMEKEDNKENFGNEVYGKNITREAKRWEEQITESVQAAQRRPSHLDTKLTDYFIRRGFVRLSHFRYIRKWFQRGVFERMFRPEDDQVSRRRVSSLGTFLHVVVSVADPCAGTGDDDLRDLDG
uniref:Uncharacterized protein n=1 Tax=Timema monikensis TaxID=170555 RepID=A0A7R9HKS6_9NEOP|nr:unnamed protein product [Timema monikensis]